MNPRDKKRLMVILGLLPVFLYLVGSNLLPLLKGKPPPPATAQATPQTTAAPTMVRASRPALDGENKSLTSTADVTMNEQKREFFLARQEQAQQAGWGRDPFFPKPIENQEDGDATIQAQLEKPPSELRLTGITRRGDSFMAMINRKAVRIGDTVEGYQVKNIQERTVTLVGQQKTYELSLSR